MVSVDLEYSWINLIIMDLMMKCYSIDKLLINRTLQEFIFQRERERYFYYLKSLFVEFVYYA